MIVTEVRKKMVCKWAVFGIACQDWHIDCNIYKRNPMEKLLIGNTKVRVSVLRSLKILKYGIQT